MVVASHLRVCAADYGVASWAHCLRSGSACACKQQAHLLEEVVRAMACCAPVGWPGGTPCCQPVKHWALLKGAVRVWGRGSWSAVEVSRDHVGCGLPDW